ncbi:hypothetical protein, partial [Paenibacillus xylanexedens]|uniref:hypothetical protein n=1 Tax=Paenibacillus xylanexedens TaxID=528191 RepID=UPI0016430031
DFWWKHWAWRFGIKVKIVRAMEGRAGVVMGRRKVRGTDGVEGMKMVMWLMVGELSVMGMMSVGRGKMKLREVKK